VIVNGLIDRSFLGENTPDFVRNHIEMQTSYLQEIEALFDGSVRGMTPLPENEARGVPMLERFAGYLFARTS
jgi:anion-transporting  ArsA/GET3 family ATPase